MESDCTSGISDPVSMMNIPGDPILGVNDPMSVIRQKSRYMDQAVRLKKRRDAFNARRANLEEIASDLKLPSLEEFNVLTTKFIKQKNINILRRIRFGLTGGEKYVKIFLEMSGAMYALIGCFTGKNVELQLEAGSTIINLGLGTEAHCHDVALKVGAYLITNMSSGNPVLQDLSAWSYGNLCGGNESVCKLAHCQGIENSLVKLLSSYALDVLQSATYALTQYFTIFPDNLEEVMSSEVVRKLVLVLDRSDTAVVEVSWCLFVISSSVKICHHLVDHGIIQATFNMLHQVINKQNLNIGASTALIRVLINCIGAVPATAVEVCYRSDQLVHICTALLYSPHCHLRSETVQLIANIFNTLTTVTQSDTGKALFDDNNLKARLKPALQSALSSHFKISH